MVAAAANAAVSITAYNPTGASINLTAQNLAQTFKVNATGTGNTTLYVEWYINNTYKQNSTARTAGYFTFTNTFANATYPMSPYRIKALAKQQGSLPAQQMFYVFVADSELPTINVTYPSNAQKVKTSNNITITANVKDNLNLSVCKFYFNNILNQTANVSGKSAPISFQLKKLNDAAYSYYIKCADKKGNEADTGVRSFEMDYINDAPVLAAVPAQSIGINRVLSVQLHATDSNNDNLTYTAYTTEPGVSISSTGLITYTPTALKNFTINATVSDNRGGVVSRVFNVNIHSPWTKMSVTAPSFGVSERQVQLTSPLKIDNTGDLPLTNIRVASAIPSRYNISFNGVASFTVPTIPVGGSASVTVGAYLTEDLDAGSTNIGNIMVNADNATQVLTPVVLNAENNLDITSLDMLSDFRDDVTGLEHKSNEIIKITPGDIIKIQFTLKNTISTSDDYNWDINDIIAKVTITGITNDDDIEYEFDPWDIKAGDDHNYEYQFHVPFTMENRQQYDITIDIEGEDENGAVHTAKWTGTFEGERKSYKIEFTALNLSTTTVSCNRDITALVKLMNTGTHDVDNAALYITSPDLLIEERDTFTTSSNPEDDTNEKTFTKKLSVPSFKQPGSYTLWFISYYDVNKESMRLSRTIQVKDCVPETTTPATTTPPAVTTAPKVNTTTPTTAVKPVVVTETEETGVAQSSSDLYVKRTYGESGVKSALSSLQNYETLNSSSTMNKMVLIGGLALVNIIIIGGAAAVALSGGAGGAAGAAGTGAAGKASAGMASSHGISDLSQKYGNAKEIYRAEPQHDDWEDFFHDLDKPSPMGRR